jgi:hypothetical protein
MAAGIAMPPAIRRRRGGHSTGTGRTAAGSERLVGALRGCVVGQWFLRLKRRAGQDILKRCFHIPMKQRENHG